MATMPAGNLIGGNLVTPSTPSNLEVSQVAGNLLPARFNKAGAYAPNQYDRERTAAQINLYGGGDITATLSAAGAGTSIVNPVLIAGNDSAIRFSGGRLDGPTFVNGATPYYTGGNVNGSTVDGSPGFYVDFCVDSVDFEIKFFTNAANRAYKVWIDGHPMTLASNVLATGSSVYRLRMQQSARRPYHVRVLSSAGFIGLSIGPNDTVWRANFALWKKRAGFLGDSFTVGANATLSTDAYPYVIAELLGWEPVIFGEAGTGYGTNGGGANGKDTFRNRVTNDVLPQAPDVMVVYGGTNDTLAPAAPAPSLQTAAANTFNDLNKLLPNAPVYVFGCQYPSGAADSTRDAKDAAILAAYNQTANITPGANSFASTLVKFTSVKTWFTGTGKVGTPTGTGNSDLFTSSDGLHPSSDGHQYIGYRMAQEIASVTD